MNERVGDNIEFKKRAYVLLQSGNSVVETAVRLDLDEW